MSRASQPLYGPLLRSFKHSEALAALFMLAIEWYDHTPLPDAVPEPRPLVPTELSRRLVAVFDEGLFCDVRFEVGGARESIGAHRIVPPHV